MGSANLTKARLNRFRQAGGARRALHAWLPVGLVQEHKAVLPHKAFRNVALH